MLPANCNTSQTLSGSGKFVPTHKVLCSSMDGLKAQRHLCTKLKWLRNRRFQWSAQVAFCVTRRAEGIQNTATGQPLSKVGRTRRCSVCSNRGAITGAASTSRGFPSKVGLWFPSERTMSPIPCQWYPCCSSLRPLGNTLWHRRVVTMLRKHADMGLSSATARDGPLSGCNS